ncbi:MAG: ZIP family metal transporter [Thermoanaerobaculia bacterium]|nr:ZIP family metal transporter [Thermoanaerobaculia bacterium]
MSVLLDWSVVLAAASLTALATGLGALPFAFVKRVSPRTVAYSEALAAGLMLGASFGLLASGTEYGNLQTLTGAVLGILFILGTDRWLDSYTVRFEESEGASGRRMLLVVLVMTVHSTAEGIAVGAGFGGGATLATVMTLAIAVHNIPEGIAISAVLRPRGTSVARCAGWSIFSSLPQPLLAVPSFLFVESVRPGLPWAIGFAAGAMIFMVLLELLPEALEEAPRGWVGLVTSLGLVGMILFQQLL